MPSTTAIPIKASTQEHLSIEDIIDDIVILKDGSCTLVLQVTAINFGLLSEEEQDAIIFAYAGLLNSLTFPIQIIIRSVGKDISDYIRLVREQEHKQKKSLLLDQLHKYRQFIEETVKDNQVLDKKFYVAIPFSNLELGIQTGVSAKFKKSTKLPYPKEYILEKAKMSLYPKRDHLVRQFGRIGLQSRQLNTQQLMELFYNLYNLESVGQQFVPSRDYQNPIVQPAIGRTNPLPKNNPFQRSPAAPPVTQPSIPTTQVPGRSYEPPPEFQPKPATPPPLGQQPVYQRPAQPPVINPGQPSQPYPQMQPQSQRIQQNPYQPPQTQGQPQYQQHQRPTLPHQQFGYDTGTT